MSDAGATERAFVVGGGDRLGFAVPMERVRRVVAASGLPASHRRVSLPGLFGATSGDPTARFAEVDAPEPDTFFELGPRADVRRVGPDALEPIPDCLATTARRWGWSALLRDGDAFRIVVDVASLAGLAAPRGRA